MVGESEMAVGEILEATLPSAASSEEPPMMVADGSSKSRFGSDSLFEPFTAKPEVRAGQSERGSGSVTVPTLVMGADDVFWVSALHNALNERGYHCGDEEEEDMFFGDGTFSALITFQVFHVDYIFLWKWNLLYVHFTSHLQGHIVVSGLVPPQCTSTTGQSSGVR